MKHTPGPWILNDGTDYLQNMADFLFAGKETDQEWTAVGTSDADGYAESVAYCHPDNARLISAAPDMLAALQQMERAFNIRGSAGFSKEVCAIKAAINKAMKG